mmetsp:Transcript_3098/g.6975  ORF Transcript_3098/g.6975 Transcript_3098/m.6975 type:complete len:215 (+) Transcript_3098:639-1283(+)
MKGPEHQTILRWVRRHLGIHNAWQFLPKVKEHDREVTCQTVLTYASDGAQRTALLKAINGVDELPSGGPTSPREGNLGIRPLERNEIETCRSPLWCGAHHHGCALTSDSCIIHLITAGINPALSIVRPCIVQRVLPSVQSHPPIGAARHNEPLVISVATVYDGIRHLYGFFELSRLCIKHRYSPLQRAMIAKRCLGSRRCANDFVVVHSHVHGG